MVSQTGKYALRILGYLVDHRGEWVQGHAIATHGLEYRMRARTPSSVFRVSVPTLP